MKILKVLVDELPANCHECSNRLNITYNCSVANNVDLFVLLRRKDRLPKCPLHIEHGDDQGSEGKNKTLSRSIANYPEESEAKMNETELCYHAWDLAIGTTALFECQKCGKLLGESDAMNRLNALEAEVERQDDVIDRLHEEM